MKKVLLTFLTIIGIATSGIAQSLEFDSYEAVTEVNSNNITDYGAHAAIKNISTSAVLVMCKRIEYSQNWCAFDSNYFCWDLCYGNETSQSLGGWTLQPGEVSHSSYFSAHVYSKNDGNSCLDSIRYVFYVDNNVNDSISAVFKFSAGPTFSVDEAKKNVSKSYPNPARNFVFVELADQPNANTTLEVYNLLGAKLLSMPVNGLKNEVNVSALTSGIYLYTISENGTAIETKKFVVKK